MELFHYYVQYQSKWRYRRRMGGNWYVESRERGDRGERSYLSDRSKKIGTAGTVISLMGLPHWDDTSSVKQTLFGWLERWLLARGTISYSAEIRKNTCQTNLT